MFVGHFSCKKQPQRSLGQGKSSLPVSTSSVSLKLWITIPFSLSFFLFPFDWFLSLQARDFEVSQISEITWAKPFNTVALFDEPSLYLTIDHLPEQLKFWGKKATVFSVKDFMCNHSHYLLLVILLIGDCKFTHVLPFTCPSPSGYPLHSHTSGTMAVLPPPIPTLSPGMLEGVNGIHGSCFWPN